MDSSKKDLESRSLGDSDLISYLIGASNLVRLTFTRDCKLTFNILI